MQTRVVLFLFAALTLTACAAPVAQPTPTAVSAPDASAASTAQPAGEQTRPMQPPSDLMAQFTAPAQAQGDLLILFGQVLDVAGAPVPDTAVEIWQTDAAGVYDHPGDPSTANRDKSFQFYGTSTVDAGGWFAFRTIMPGEYEPRPRHIHVKVKQKGVTLLTSQFYFISDDAKLATEGIFQSSGPNRDVLVLQPVEGDGAQSAQTQIVVDTGIGAGKLALTPAETEGPYYPVAPLADYDNDLAVVP